MSNGIAKCLETMDFVPETCKFIKKCKPGQVRNEAGKCVKGDNLSARIRKLRTNINSMKKKNVGTTRGIIKAQLVNLMKDAGTPNRERIQKLIISAEKLTNHEAKIKANKDAKSAAFALKKIEREKKENEKLLKKQVAVAKKEAAETKKAERQQTLAERKATAAARKTAKKGILGTALNVPLVELSAIASSGVKDASKSGSSITPVLSVVESAVKAMSKSPSVEKFSGKKTSPISL
jgi:hypothetical protein